MIEVTKASATTINVVETRAVPSTENIDDLFRRLKDRYAQKAREIEDRDAEIAALWSLIDKAKAATVEPTAAVDAIKTEVEALKSAGK